MDTASTSEILEECNSPQNTTERVVKIAPNAVETSNEVPINVSNETEKGVASNEIEKTDASNETEKGDASNETEKGVASNEIEKTDASNETEKGDASNEIEKDDASNETEKGDASNEIEKTDAVASGSSEIGKLDCDNSELIVADNDEDSGKSPAKKSKKEIASCSTEEKNDTVSSTIKLEDTTNTTDLNAITVESSEYINVTSPKKSGIIRKMYNRLFKKTVIEETKEVYSEERQLERKEKAAIIARKLAEADDVVDSAESDTAKVDLVINKAAAAVQVIVGPNKTHDDYLNEYAFQLSHHLAVYELNETVVVGDTTLKPDIYIRIPFQAIVEIETKASIEPEDVKHVKLYHKWRVIPVFIVNFGKEGGPDVKRIDPAPPKIPLEVLESIALLSVD